MLPYELTPGAERALAAAARWTNRTDDPCFDAIGLLLGLLAEPESRAAIILDRFGVDATAVRRQWPELVERLSTSDRDSALLQHMLQAAATRLLEHPQRLEFGTEHLLLGLLAVEHEASAWLQGRGISAELMTAEVQRLHGVALGPLDFEEEVLPSNSPRVRQAAGLIPEGQTVRSQRSEVRGQKSEVPVLRTLDAAANRAREGLRVVEDYVRFQLDDRHLTERLKILRHELTQILSRLPADQLFAARETQADVGTSLATPSEQSRADLAAVVTANFKRLQESLRSLEEFSKLLNSDISAALEQLRYEAYTLERAVAITGDSLGRLAHERLYVLIDGRESLAAFETLARSLIEAGVHVLQLRDKRLSDRELIGRARLLRQLTAGIDPRFAGPGEDPQPGNRTLFIMNDRPDLAVLSGADGVHIGQDELSVKDVRTIVGPKMLIGVSTHSIDQARSAVLDGANYIGMGPTFASSTKHFAQFPGLDLVRAVTQEIRLPAFAIGGINAGNLLHVIESGSTRVAVSSAVCSAADPAASVRNLLKILANRYCNPGGGG